MIYSEWCLGVKDSSIEIATTEKMCLGNDCLDSYAFVTDILKFITYYFFPIPGCSKSSVVVRVINNYLGKMV